MTKRWNILDTNAEKTSSLHEVLKINKTLCAILVQRGIDTYEKAKDFFRPQLSQLHSPWMMKDMDKAVSRILNAFQQHEKVLVFGDYDVDGTTAVASMYQYLSSIYDQVDFYIPHRYREGYGVSKMGIDYAKETGVSLIISLDCGIKSVDLIAYAKALHIDFIICDHHLPDQELPPAVAILNPKQVDCTYPYKELCGCGVGFKLMTAISEKLSLPETTHFAYLDLVATAIAADIVPINGENRILAYYGLEKVNQNPCAGIKALMQLAAVQKKMHITNLVFIIAPRVNAAGRMDDAKKAVQLFIEKDPVKAMAFAEMLHSDNADRREADSTITEEALALIEADPTFANKKTTVVYQEHWHKGVVGIVASRLIEKHYRPTVVLTKSGDYIAGSARSVAGFNLYEAIHACREHLLGYGGHFAAAGMTLLPEKVDDFAAAFEKAVQEQIQPEQLIPEIIIDAPIHFESITPILYSILTQMEPFGPDNMRPIFIAEKVYDTGFSKIVKEQHIRFVVKQRNITLTGIGFNMANKFELLQRQQPLDLVFTLDENEWNGEKIIQLKMIDLRLSN
ncbi:MAG: single-stranded-DNA-specific exonuclease RecJ [Sediminibacterium sp.]|jgi:single-stranded-DNA-specific exonuclease|uniref:single-stranded-DNA-specific exonuclease RecJ n=1 Tax=Sediminibacterium sp. TaxID=1917865 RepID=UPI002AB9D9F1|nr:single-stranded-DNA-specific exonuclease RecJ [Sediminibacterium sp.]MDZ4072380.1 single-stranded-DNA-specific exonuclease RecJ [Sediminibacterium sp.]